MTTKEKLYILLWELAFNLPAYFCYWVVFVLFFTNEQTLFLAVVLFFTISIKDAQIEELKRRIIKLEENGKL